MLWHEIFGIEQNLEALFSPTHLMLATGAFFFVSGPLRAAWQRKGGRGWGELLPAVLSVTMLFSMFTFFTQYANIFGNPAVLNTNIGGTRYFIEVTSVSYILIPAALMMGSILLVMRRWQLPFGSLTLMFVVNALVMLLMRFEFASPYWRTVVAAGIGGLFADILVLWLQPSAVRHNILRLFAFLVPFVYFLLVLGAIALTGPRGLWWEIHTWLGVPFVAGTIGVGLSFLVVSPPQPVE
ncbi:MAG: hypothetical protein R3E39_13305 [Anaerolineae bacterium]